MLILICCIILVVLGIIGIKYRDDNLFELSVLETLGLGSLVIGLFGLLLIGMTVPLTHMKIQSKIYQVEALQQTVQNARESNVNLEKATIQRRIAKKNEWIRSQQYWNNTIFDMWIPDNIKELESIK